VRVVQWGIIGCLVASGIWIGVRSNSLPFAGINSKTNQVVLQNPFKEFRGLYQEEDRKGPFGLRLLGSNGLRFLNDTQVDMLSSNGEKIGDTVNYQIQGNEIVIKHKCGVWYLEIRGEKLFHKEFKSYFKRSATP